MPTCEKCKKEFNMTLRELIKHLSVGDEVIIWDKGNINVDSKKYLEGIIIQSKFIDVDCIVDNKAVFIKENGYNGSIAHRTLDLPAMEKKEFLKKGFSEKQ